MDQRSRVLMAAVLGAGVVIGTAGVLLYNKIFGKQHVMLAHLESEIKKIDQSLLEIRDDLDEIRKRRRRRFDDDEIFSTTSTEDEDEEFYDISDEDGESEPVETEPLLVRLFGRVDVLMDGSDQDRVLSRQKMLDHLEVFPDNGALLWRLAKCNNSLAKVESDVNFRTRLLEQGLHFAQRSVEAQPRSAEANKWCAIMTGQYAEKLGTKQRILNGFIFKKHVDAALKLAPNDPSLHHLAGRFNFEVASLGWLERKVAATLFADPPKGSFEEANDHFVFAEQLSQEPWRENRLFLGETNIALKNIPRALFWLNQSLAAPNISADDAAMDSKARLLIAKYSEQ